MVVRMCFIVRFRFVLRVGFVLIVWCNFFMKMLLVMFILIFVCRVSVFVVVWVLVML